jgi:hypothetical protein
MRAMWSMGPDQQRITPEDIARRKTRVNALMALRSIRGTQTHFHIPAARCVRVVA